MGVVTFEVGNCCVDLVSVLGDMENVVRPVLEVGAGPSSIGDELGRKVGRESKDIMVSLSG